MPEGDLWKRCWELDQERREDDERDSEETAGNYLHKLQSEEGLQGGERVDIESLGAAAHYCQPNHMDHWLRKRAESRG